MILDFIQTLFLVIHITFIVYFICIISMRAFLVLLESHSKSKRCQQLADDSRHHSHSLHHHSYKFCCVFGLTFGKSFQIKRHSQLADDIGVIQTLLVVIHRSFCWVLGLCHCYESFLVLLESHSKIEKTSPIS